MLDWLNTNAAALGLVLGALPIIWGAFNFIAIKRAEQKQLRFENYHRLVKDLVQGDGETMKIDRQLAVIFEMKNYPEYAPATEKILKGFQEVVDKHPSAASKDGISLQIKETLRALGR